MYRLQVRQFVVVGVHANAEEEASVSAVHNLVVAELRAQSGERPLMRRGRDVLRQSWIDTSGLVGLLADGPHHANEPGSLW